MKKEEEEVDPPSFSKQMFGRHEIRVSLLLKYTTLNTSSIKIKSTRKKKSVYSLIYSLTLIVLQVLICDL